jgi:hypothetical protein
MLMMGSSKASWSSHVASDHPDAKLDGLDRRPVVRAHLAVQRFLDDVLAPAPVVDRRRTLRQPPVPPALHLDLLHAAWRRRGGGERAGGRSADRRGAPAQLPSDDVRALSATDPRSLAHASRATGKQDAKRNAMVILALRPSFRRLSEKLAAQLEIPALRKGPTDYEDRAIVTNKSTSAANANAFLD